MNEMLSEKEKEFFDKSFVECKAVLEKYMSKKELSIEEAAQMAWDLRLVAQKLSSKKENDNENR